MPADRFKKRARALARAPSGPRDDNLDAPRQEHGEHHQRRQHQHILEGSELHHSSPLPHPAATVSDSVWSQPPNCKIAIAARVAADLIRPSRPARASSAMRAPAWSQRKRASSCPPLPTPLANVSDSINGRHRRSCGPPCRIFPAPARRDDRSRKPHDARIFTPHTTTNANIVNDATNNALSMEASFITPPSASYPGLNLGDSIVWRQPGATVFPLWISSITCAAGNQNAFLALVLQSVEIRTTPPGRSP